MVDILLCGDVGLSIQKTYYFSPWVTDACNKRCRYCFYGASKIFQDWTPSYMDNRVCDATIKFINSGMVEGISFFGGEPLLNWEMIKRILQGSKLDELMKDKGMRNNVYSITTNGTLFTPEILDILAKYKVHINLSLDGTPETQNLWRDNSYNEELKHLDLLLKYPNIGILKTLADPSRMYIDIKHIKDLGFKNVYINLLDPYSDLLRYDDDAAEVFRVQYEKTIRELHKHDGFNLNDYESWLNLIKPGINKGIGCGYSNRGLGMSPTGLFYPCHEGPSLSENYSIGNVFDGIDHQKEEQVRKVTNAPSCVKCPYKLTKCYVSMVNKYGRFDVDPPDWYTKVERAKIETINKIANLSQNYMTCDKSNILNETTLVSVPISEDKLYLMKPFVDSLNNMMFPPKTDIMFLLNSKTKNAIEITMSNWLSGNLLGVQKPLAFRYITVEHVPYFINNDKMWMIARARRMTVDIARRHNYNNIFFLDFDILAPSDTFPKLLGVDAEIVGGLVRNRRDTREGWYNNYVINEQKTFDTINNFKDGEILDVDATGCDCLLVRRKAFMKDTFIYKPEIPEAEDMGFCLRSRKRGFRVKIHTGVKVHHILYRDIIIDTQIQK